MFKPINNYKKKVHNNILNSLQIGKQPLLNKQTNQEIPIKKKIIQNAEEDVLGLINNINKKLEKHDMLIKVNTLSADGSRLIDGFTNYINSNFLSIKEIEKQTHENKDEIAMIENFIIENEKQTQENKDEIAKIEILTIENNSQINNILTKLNKLIIEINNPIMNQPNFYNLKKSVSQIVFSINNNIYNGSGWFYAENNDDLSKGYYITAAHCVMQITNGNYYKASVIYIQNPITNKWISINVNNVYVDGIADIALIESGIDLTNYPTYCLKLANKMPEAGTQCYVIGNPGGIDEDSISVGSIRNAHYTEPSGYQITDCIHVNTPGMGGNSGGPIVNNYGDVIGIYTFGLGNGFETFGGGSNRDTLSKTLTVLKTKQNNKTKLYLGLHWVISNPFILRTFYNNASTFDSKGVYIKTVSSSSPFFNVLSTGCLLLECIVAETNDKIEFGSTDKQRTPGLLIYYPLNTVINIKYIKPNTSSVLNANITLNKNYSNVSALLDGPLQTGKSEEIEESRKIYNPIKFINKLSNE